MTIRKATEADAPALSELICENAKATLLPHYTPEQWNIFIRYYSPEVMLDKIRSQIVFCAVKNNQIVGTIALDKNFVVGFYTRLENLHQGIGVAMMQYLEAYAAAQGLQEIQLAASPVGLNFYYKNGWKKIKDMAMEYYGVQFEETLMVKNIASLTR